MTDDIQEGPHRRFSTRDPELADRLTRSGDIWAIDPAAGADAIINGRVPLDEAKGIPAGLRAKLERALGATE